MVDDGGAVEDGSLVFAGSGFVEDLEDGFGAWDPGGLDLDAGVFALEAFDDGADDLVDDEAGVPGDGAFLAGGVDQ